MNSGQGLVCVDLQNDFCHPDGVYAAAGLRLPDPAAFLGDCRRVVGLARAAGLPVIWVATEFRTAEDWGLLGERRPSLVGKALVPGTWGSRIVDELPVVPSTDSKVTKRRFSAFYGTGLEEVLHRYAVSHPYVIGVRTDYCVESTVRDAFFRDLQVTVISDAVASYDVKSHRRSLEQMGSIFARIITGDELEREWQPEVG